MIGNELEIIGFHTGSEEADAQIVDAYSDSIRIDKQDPSPPSMLILKMGNQEVSVFSEHLTLWHWTKIFIRYVKPFREKLKSK